MFIWKGCRKLENEPRVPGLFLAKTKSRKILRQDKSFEGTLYSHGHNSWESFKFTSLFDATIVNGRSIVYTKDDFGKDFQCGNPASVVLCLF